MDIADRTFSHHIAFQPIFSIMTIRCLHLDSIKSQRVFGVAVILSTIDKPSSPHSFRQIYANHPSSRLRYPAYAILGWYPPAQ